MRDITQDNTPCQKSNAISNTSLNNQYKMYFSYHVFEVFSDYFESNNVLYIGRGSHNSGNFINKYMTLI